MGELCYSCRCNRSRLALLISLLLATFVLQARLVLCGCYMPSWQSIWQPSPSSTPPQRTARYFRVCAGAAVCPRPVLLQQSTSHIIALLMCKSAHAYPVNRVGCLQEEALALELWHTPRGKWWPLEVRLSSCNNSCALLDHACITSVPRASTSCVLHAMLVLFDYRLAASPGMSGEARKARAADLDR